MVVGKNLDIPTFQQPPLLPRTDFQQSFLNEDGIIWKTRISQESLHQRTGGGLKLPLVGQYQPGSVITGSVNQCRSNTVEIVQPALSLASTGSWGLSEPPWLQGRQNRLFCSCISYNCTSDPEHSQVNLPPPPKSDCSALVGYLTTVTPRVIKSTEAS